MDEICGFQQNYYNSSLSIEKLEIPQKVEKPIKVFHFTQSFDDLLTGLV